jgi:integrase/recombinase XerD
MSKTKAHISPLFHRGEEFIKVSLPNTDIAKSLIRSVTGRKWSQTHRCWYVPKTTAVYKELQEKFELSIETTTLEALKSKETEIKPTVSPAKIKHKPLPTFFEIKQQDGRIQKRVTGNKILLVPEKESRFKVFIPFDKKGWIAAVKEIPGRAWNMDESYWSVPYVKMSFRLLKKNIGMHNLSIGFIINADIPEEIKVPLKSQKVSSPTGYNLLNNLQQEAVTALNEKLMLERLAVSTMKSYKHHLTGLLLHYKNLKPDEISKKQFEQYLLHLIRFKKISESTQSSIINAVKAYWERVLKRGKEWIEIPRPKRPKKMPNVLSIEEVTALISAPKNLKHKFALLLIYSAGLRRSELLNLKTKDINISRRSIHIKGGKGKRDRYVLLAESAVPFLNEYKKQFRPINWLFEGQYGGQYSASSLQSIFQNALQESKVNAYATLHTLRHSYATHCVEEGHNLKSVQDALGHNSLKTTEIYLHISSKALKKLKSPLDNLDIK